MGPPGPASDTDDQMRAGRAGDAGLPVGQEGGAGVFAHRFVWYAWGTIVRPGPTFEALATERSVRCAVLVAALGVCQVWGNMALFAIFGFDWLGSRPPLADPTYVGGFGYLSVSADRWLPIFAALMPVLALYGLVVVPGAAHLLSKLWGGRGSYEQMVNVLTFATVPGLVIGWLSAWLTGVPLNLLSGRPYFHAAAMKGPLAPPWRRSRRSTPRPSIGPPGLGGSPWARWASAALSVPRGGRRC